VGNAIERFLDRDPKELVEVSRQTLEGHLRTMVAALSPEQVNEDRLRFAHEVGEVVQPEMGKLGLRLDTFKILRVSDQVEYYDSLGRARLAEVLRDAPIAEAEGFADADQREAEAQQRAEVARTEARTIVLQAQNALRTTTAQLDQQARQAEDRVEAAASVNDRLSAVWHSAGEEAAAIVLLQQVETIVAEAAQLAGQLELGHIDVLESGSPASLAELVTLYPAVMRGFLNSVRDILGIDVLSALTVPPSRP
jgi:flotillin